MRKARSNRPIIATGVISLITFFSILLLTSFSFLILSSANTDSELAEKTALSVSEHFAADNFAEQKLVSLSEIVNANTGEELLTALSVGGFLVVEDLSFEGMVVEYSVPINDKKMLYVKIGIDSDNTLHRLSWQTQPLLLL